MDLDILNRGIGRISVCDSGNCSSAWGCCGSNLFRGVETGARMSANTGLLIVAIIAGSLLLAAVIVALTLWLIKRLRPANFNDRPPATGLEMEHVVPKGVMSFEQVERVCDQPRQTCHAVYRRAGGINVHFTAVRAESVNEAVKVLSRLRYKGVVRTTSVAKIAGDRSFFTQKRAEGHLIAWTNGEWTFAAQSRDKDEVRLFVQEYSY
jgi:hypothetical protein